MVLHLIVRRLCQILFWAALIFTFVYAEMPRADAPQLMSSDKSDHVLAFYGLAILAAAAFPRSRLAILALLLSGFGAMIELVQALPIVNRDADFWDWVADTIGIASAFGPLILVRWLSWLCGLVLKDSKPKLPTYYDERVENDCPIPRPKITA